MKSLRLSLIWVAVLLLLGSCGDPTSTITPIKREQPKMVQAELDIFSGRPNPAWTLSDQEVAELVLRLAKLNQPLQSVNPPSDGLGYRGFVISNSNGLSGLPSQLRIYKGTINLTSSGQSSYYQDTAALESWLTELARQHGYGAMVDQINNP